MRILVVAHVRVDGRHAPQGLPRITPLRQAQRAGQPPQLRRVVHSRDSDRDFEKREAPPERAVVCSVMRERKFIELMTWDRKLKASREGSK